MFHTKFVVLFMGFDWNLSFSVLLFWISLIQFSLQWLFWFVFVSGLSIPSIHSFVYDCTSSSYWLFWLIALLPILTIIDLILLPLLIIDYTSLPFDFCDWLHFSPFWFFGLIVSVPFDSSVWLHLSLLVLIIYGRFSLPAHLFGLIWWLDSSVWMNSLFVWWWFWLHSLW